MNNYLFGFEGRINRTGWWIGQGILILIFLIWFKYYGLSFMPSIEMSSFELNAELQVNDPIQDQKSPNSFSISYLFMAFAFCWVWMAITAKRLHDIGKSGWWGVPGIAPSLFFALVLFVIPPEQLPVGTLSLMSVANIVQSVAGLWLLRNCGMKAGDDGTNDYGPPSDSERRSEALEQEVSMMAGKNFAKLDDAYFANYTKQYAKAQANPQSVTNTNLGHNIKPSFGKR